MRCLGDELGLKQRWKLWRKRRVVFPPDEIHQAGENAELRLRSFAGRRGKPIIGPSIHLYGSLIQMADDEKSI